MWCGYRWAARLRLSATDHLLSSTTTSDAVAESQASGRPLGETVLILNLGTAIEAGASTGKFSGMYQGASSFSTTNTGVEPRPGVGWNRPVHQQYLPTGDATEWASVFCFGDGGTLDDLIFGQNQCWLDGATATAFLDAFLIAGSHAGHQQPLPRGAQLPRTGFGIHDWRPEHHFAEYFDLLPVRHWYLATGN